MIGPGRAYKVSTDCCGSRVVKRQMYDITLLSCFGSQTNRPLNVI